jgi:flagellar hook assembly protein FlgD
LVTTLVNGRQPAGRHTVTWNRTDGTGNRVASGVYFYKLTSGNYRTTRKLVVE